MASSVNCLDRFLPRSWAESGRLRVYSAVNKSRWTRNRAATSGGCTEYVRNGRSRPVPFCGFPVAVWGGSEGQQRRMEGSKLGEHRPASRYTVHLPDVAGVQCQQIHCEPPASSSCSSSKFCLSRLALDANGRYHLRAPRWMQKSQPVSARPSPPSEPGQEHVGGAWIGDLLPETIRSALRLCPVVSSALSPRRLAASPS